MLLVIPLFKYCSRANILLPFEKLKPIEEIMRLKGAGWEKTWGSRELGMKGERKGRYLRREVARPQRWYFRGWVWGSQSPGFPRFLHPGQALKPTGTEWTGEGEGCSGICAYIWSKITGAYWCFAAVDQGPQHNCGDGETWESVKADSHQDKWGLGSRIKLSKRK